ncbi:hypothetical protein BGY98DRAFT_1018227 [Russula aff. rugulosa BPL654]|nr:hypothetical protein BGY98DRAFT_1018227 [Russula aff. rugulosa BPL654]
MPPSPPPSSFLTGLFVTTAPCDFLDGKHVVFGKVIDGMLTLRKIKNVPTGLNNRPKLVQIYSFKPLISAWFILHGLIQIRDQ